MLDSGIVDSLWRSWIAEGGVESLDALHAWIMERNANTAVSIERIALSDCIPWRYDEARGRITNPTGAFFQIAGLRKMSTDVHTGHQQVLLEQPVLIQDEIGYLGIVCKVFDGVAHFLMQAKIEPGNVNKVQVSPTIQATRSNFLQLHGGKRPAYLDYFLESEKHNLLVDQIQSEQSARFVGKRNRNVIVLVDDDVDVLPTHKWMTLGQIKRLMDYDNLVNMDTRTVLSCLPWSFWGAPDGLVAPVDAREIDAALLASIATPFDMDAINKAYRSLNNYKMFDTTHTELVSLTDLAEWKMLPDEVCHVRSYPFRVIYCDIAIEGREVVRWNQPLFEATGIAFFGLLSCVRNGKLEFLVRLKPEIGCFDKVELGPTVQREADVLEQPDALDQAFIELCEAGTGVVRDVLLSEEGGRFFCEQNRNVLIRLDECPHDFDDVNLPDGCFWLDYATLNLLVRANNVLNIQLRNLLSLLDIHL